MKTPIYFVILFFSFLLYFFYVSDFFFLKDNLILIRKSICLNRSTISHDFRKLKRKTKAFFIHFIQTDLCYYNHQVFNQHFPTKKEWSQSINYLFVRCFISFNCFIHCEMALFWEHVLFINRSTCQSRFTLHDHSVYCIHFFSYKKYNMVFSFHHQSGALFGHFITDVLPKLVLIPNFYYQNALFLTNKLKNKRVFVDDAYLSFGVPQSNLLQLSDRTIFTEHAIILEIGECIFPNPFILSQFRKMANKFYLLLDLKPPFKNVLYNRNFGHKKLHRRILNFDEIFYFAIKKFIKNEIKFETNNEILHFRIIEQAKIFNEYKLLFAVDGAGLGNTLFMQKYTILIEILHSSLNNYLGFFVMAMSYCRFFIAARDEHILLTQNSPNVISATLFIKLITMALKKLEKKNISQMYFKFNSLLSFKENR